MHLALWHGLTPAILLSALTLALDAAPVPVPRVGPAARLVVEVCARSGSTPLTLAGLDRLSGRVAPALQSGSLRSYVR